MYVDRQIDIFLTLLSRVVTSSELKRPLSIIWSSGFENLGAVKSFCNRLGMAVYTFNIKHLGDAEAGRAGVQEESHYTESSRSV